MKLVPCAAIMTGRPALSPRRITSSLLALFSTVVWLAATTAQARPVCIKVQNDSILRDCMEIDSFVTKSLEPLKAIDVTQVCVGVVYCVCVLCVLYVKG